MYTLSLVTHDSGRKYFKLQTAAIKNVNNNHHNTCLKKTFFLQIYRYN